MNEVVKSEVVTGEIRSTPTAELQEQNASEIVFDGSKFEAIERIADIMSSGGITVPEHLRGNKGDCFAVVLQAMMWKMNPFAVAQKTHIVNGKLGYEAQLVNAAVTTSRAIVGFFNFEYRGEGQNLACRVGAVLRGSNEITWGEFLCIADVTIKNSPLWKSNPRQQLGYLQVKNWARLYTPGAMLGVYSVDELEDADVIKDTPRYQQPQMIAQAPNASASTPRYAAPQQRTAPPSQPHDANSNVISESQAKRLYAIGKERNLTNDEMSYVCFKMCGVNSSREIPRDKYDAVVQAFETAETGKLL